MSRPPLGSFELLAALAGGGASAHSVAEGVYEGDQVLCGHLAEALFRNWDTLSDEGRWLAADRAVRLIDSERLGEMMLTLARRGAPHASHAVARLGASLSPRHVRIGRRQEAALVAPTVVGIRVNFGSGAKVLSAREAWGLGSSCQPLAESEWELAYAFLDGISAAACHPSDAVQRLLRDCPWVLECDSAATALLRATGHRYADAISPDRLPFLLVAAERAPRPWPAWPALFGRNLELAIQHVLEGRYVSRLSQARLDLDGMQVLRSLESAFAIREAARRLPASVAEPAWRESIAHLRSGRVGEHCGGVAVVGTAQLLPEGCASALNANCRFAIDEQGMAYRAIVRAQGLGGCSLFSMEFGGSVSNWEVTCSAPDIDTVMAVPFSPG
jgi:hypothetical protein